VVIALLLGAIIAIYCIHWNSQEPVIVYDNRIPPVPTVRYPDKYWLWDSGRQEWILRSIGPSRAKATSKPTQDKVDLDDQFQEYLEKKIPEYEDETYWGEEWNTGQEPPD